MASIMSTCVIPAWVLVSQYGQTVSVINQPIGNYLPWKNGREKEGSRAYRWKERLGQLGSKQTMTIPCRMQLRRPGGPHISAVPSSNFRKAYMKKIACKARNWSRHRTSAKHKRKQLACKARSVLLQYDATYLGESAALSMTINEG
jgi:hypothetical protein